MVSAVSPPPPGLGSAPGASSRGPAAACTCCSHSPGQLSSLMLFFGNLCSIAKPLPCHEPLALLSAAAQLRERRPQTRVGTHQICWGREGPG